MRVVVTTAAIDVAQELARFTDKGAGAMASFVGYCRARSHEHAVERLELQHYPGFTEAEIERLAGEIAARRDVADVLVIHRVGAIDAGEAIVLAAALSAHRAAAFAAVSDVMDLLKTEAPIWKQEIGPDGARWIEPSAEDRARRDALKDQP
jgi:molybdopterin synthase catalytic subunit